MNDDEIKKALGRTNAFLDSVPQPLRGRMMDYIMNKNGIREQATEATQNAEVAAKRMIHESEEAKIFGKVVTK